MYFLTCLFCLYVRLKTGLITIIYILDTHLFSNFVILTFDYDLCGVLVENLEFCIFCRYIYVFPASTHSASQQRHLTTLNFHHPHTVCISVLYSLLLRWVMYFSYLYYREMHLRTYIHLYFPLTYNNSPIFIICYIKISRNFAFLTNIKYVHLWYFQTQLFCRCQRNP